MGQLEKFIERDIVDLAVTCGWWTCKFVAPGLRGVPDRIFIRAGKVIFIEVKKVGEVPTVQQQRRHREMRAAGVDVYWFDNLDDAKRVLR